LPNIKGLKIYIELPEFKTKDLSCDLGWIGRDQEEDTIIIEVEIFNDIEAGFRLQTGEILRCAY
jgi:hypothetical protein